MVLVIVFALLLVCGLEADICDLIVGLPIYVVNAGLFCVVGVD